MFGMSFWKIVLLVAVVVAVWCGFRWFERAQKEKSRIAARPARNREPGTQDLVACGVCGTFVDAIVARPCGRAGCPFPR